MNLLTAIAPGPDVHSPYVPAFATMTEGERLHASAALKPGLDGV